MINLMPSKISSQKKVELLGETSKGSLNLDNTKKNLVSREKRI